MRVRARARPVQRTCTLPFSHPTAMHAALGAAHVALCGHAWPGTSVCVKNLKRLKAKLMASQVRWLMVLLERLRMAEQRARGVRAARRGVRAAAAAALMLLQRQAGRNAKRYAKRQKRGSEDMDDGL